MFGKFKKLFSKNKILDNDNLSDQVIDKDQDDCNDLELHEILENIRYILNDEEIPERDKSNPRKIYE